MKHINANQSGVTLMELLVVVAIVGILAAIGYPSYRQSVVKSNRTEAKTALQQNAEALEKCYTRFSAYNDTTNCPAASQFAAGASVDTERRIYTITGNIQATTFTLTATPQAGQAQDSKCGTLTLDQTNTRTKSGTAALSECW